MVKLYRCEICGDPYIGNQIPTNCPFCGVKANYIKEFKQAKVNFNVELNEKDKTNVEKALQVEISNTEFYRCAENKTDDPEGKVLFKALRKVETEHASVWKKILKLKTLPEKTENCSTNNKENLQESHDRETKAIEFYKQAEKEAENQRVKEIFKAFIEVETDHLKLSKERL